MCLYMVGFGLVCWFWFGFFKDNFPSVTEQKRDKKCDETKGNNFPNYILNWRYCNSLESKQHYQRRFMHKHAQYVNLYNT